MFNYGYFVGGVYSYLSVQKQQKLDPIHFPSQMRLAYYPFIHFKGLQGRIPLPKI